MFSAYVNIIIYVLYRNREIFPRRNTRWTENELVRNTKSSDFQKVVSSTILSDLGGAVDGQCIHILYTHRRHNVRVAIVARKKNLVDHDRTVWLLTCSRARV